MTEYIYWKKENDRNILMCDHPSVTKHWVYGGGTKGNWSNSVVLIFNNDERVEFSSNCIDASPTIQKANEYLNKITNQQIN